MYIVFCASCKVDTTLLRHGTKWKFFDI